MPGTLPSSSELSLSFSALRLGPSEVGCGLGGVERAVMKTQMWSLPPRVQWVETLVTLSTHSIKGVERDTGFRVKTFRWSRRVSGPWEAGGGVSQVGWRAGRDTWVQRMAGAVSGPPLPLLPFGVPIAGRLHAPFFFVPPFPGCSLERGREMGMCPGGGLRL